MEIKTILTKIHIIETVKLIGEGEYNLNDLKEIRVTESYLGLDQDAMKCQDKEPRINCTTRKYLDTLLEKCGCLPITVKLSNKVHFYSTFKILALLSLT